MFDIDAFSTTPKPTPSDHGRGINIARTRDSVTRQERSRAVVAKAARSVEDGSISLVKRKMWFVSRWAAESRFLSALSAK
jgi:hypothetical protein